MLGLGLMLLWEMDEGLKFLVFKFRLLDLNFLNLIYIVVFDAETALENAKRLERLELQIFFSFS